MSIQTAAGVRFFIGGKVVPETFTEAGYNTAATWVEVGEVEDLNEFGDEVNPVTFTALGDPRVRKFKGSYDAGTMNLTVGFDAGDDGQEDLSEALEDSASANYLFKIEYNDDPDDGANSAPTKRFFSGKVMSMRENVGSVDNIIRASVNIGIDTEVIKVAALNNAP